MKIHPTHLWLGGLALLTIVFWKYTKILVLGILVWAPVCGISAVFPANWQSQDGYLGKSCETIADCQPSYFYGMCEMIHMDCYSGRCAWNK